MAFTSAYALKFVAYGDSRDDMTTFGSINNRIGGENPECIVFAGDCWGSSSQTSWVNAIKANTVTNALLNANLYLVSRGNHESFSQLSAVSPTVVKNSSERYSFTQGNCFFVSMGMNPSSDYTWMQQQLSSAASTAASWRFIFNHYPIYSTGSHGADGSNSSGASIDQYRALCDQYHVTMCFAGHDHIYERTKLIYNGAAVGSGTTFNISTTPGTVYCVTGGAGAPLYGVGSDWWTGYANGTYNYVVLNATADTVYATAKDENGSVIDAFKIIKNHSTAVAQNAGEKSNIGLRICALGNNAFAVAAPAGAKCAIYDILGNSIMRKSISAAGEPLNISFVKKGLYIARITFAGQTLVRSLAIR
jgi:predicted phosphodiesterase